LASGRFTGLCWATATAVPAVTINNTNSIFFMFSFSFVPGQQVVALSSIFRRLRRRDALLSATSFLRFRFAKSQK
jgi:hypothetical protein